MVNKSSKRILCLILSVVFMVSMIPEAVFSYAENIDIAMSYSVGSTVINTQKAENENYIFLPSDADLSNFKLTAEGYSLLYDGKDMSEGVDISALSADDGVYKLDITVSNGNESFDYKLNVMKSANIGSMFLTSEEGSGGREYVDAVKGNKIEGNMLMNSASGKTIYDGALSQIKSRGSSSFKYYPKKSYQIKLDQKTALVDGSKKGKTWVLIASYNDGTKMVDKIFKDIANEVGQKYAPKEDIIDLYFDGEYRGTYMLSEKNQIGSGRIDITDMEDAYADANPDISYGDDALIQCGINKYGNKFYYTLGLNEPEKAGGFLLEFNGVDYGDEASWFKLSSGIAVNVKSPEFAGYAAMKYISEYMQEFENAVHNPDRSGKNPDTGKYFYDYVDIDSLVQSYLIEDLGSNNDGFFRSLFLYMDTDGIMKSGPCWDLDQTLGTGWIANPSPQTDTASGTLLGSGLIQLPLFRSKLSEEYEKHFKSAGYALLGYEDEMAETGIASIAQRAEAVRASAMMDKKLWHDYLKTASAYSGYPNRSYQEYVDAGRVASFELWPEDFTFDDFIKFRTDWLTEHMSWMNRYFSDLGKSAHQHNFGAAVDLGDGNHQRTCIICGETLTEAHNFSSYEYLGEGKHICKCAVCGIAGEEEDCEIVMTKAEATITAPIVENYDCSKCLNHTEKTIAYKVGDTFSPGFIKYRITSPETVEIIGVASDEKTGMTFPETTTFAGVTYKITAIGEKAFADNKNLEKVYIGTNVTEIKAQAFEGCSSLISVAGTASVEIVGNRAFRNCTSLELVTTLQKAKTIGEYAFANDSKLYQIGGTDGVIGLYGAATLYKQAFVYCTNIRKVNASANLKVIGVSAFEGDTNLSSIAGTSGVTHVGHRAFRKCSSLATVSTLSNAKVIGDYAFQYCSKLHQIGGTKLVIGLYSVQTIGRQAFAFCTNMSKMIASANLKVIGVSAFEGDTKLAAVAGTSGVTHVGHRAFRKCANLATISTLSNAKVIGDYAFQYCSKLHQIGGVKLVIGLYKVEAIGRQAFAFCTNIRRVYINAPLKTIGAAAFYGCSRLSDITLKSAKLATPGQNAFKKIAGKPAVKVLKSKEALMKRYFGKTAKISIVK